MAKARDMFEQARDNDTVICRATKDIVQVLKDLQQTQNLELVDTEKILISEAPGGILGEPIIQDNVHFSLRGHSRTGRALADEIAKRNWIEPLEKWQFNRERPYEEILRELAVTPDVLLNAYLHIVAYYNITRYENRLRYSQKALKINPRHPRALRHLAWTYWTAGKKEKAGQVYQKLAQVDPGQLAEVLLQNPDLKKAVESAPGSQQSLQSSPVQHQLIS
jgi:tetratricopeptide (TPR) repeat protein